MSASTATPLAPMTALDRVEAMLKLVVEGANGDIDVDVTDGALWQVKVGDEVVAFISNGTRVTRVDRRRTKTDGKGNERQKGDHKAARSWNREWEAFRLTDENFDQVAKAIIERVDAAVAKQAEQAA
jgi:hypothetical protein